MTVKIELGGSEQIVGGIYAAQRPEHSMLPNGIKQTTGP